MEGQGSVQCAEGAIVVGGLRVERRGVKIEGPELCEYLRGAPAAQPLTRDMQRLRGWAHACCCDLHIVLWLHTPTSVCRALLGTCD